MGTKRSTLFIASSAANVVITGSVIKITGLPEFRKSEIIDYSLKVAVSETVQVVTVGSVGPLYTPTGGTRYKILLGDPTVRVNGKENVLKSFSITTPLVITDFGANAAAQRETINSLLVAQINASTSSYVVAASLLTGNGFTITDKPGYFPYNSQNAPNRKGATTVKVVTNPDGSGFSSSNMVLTVPAVYAFGIGADLLNLNPIFNFSSQNLIAGDLESYPKTDAGLPPVVGQRYNMFNITLNKTVADGGGIGEGINGKRNFSYSIWVDNGTGTNPANLAGYGTFLTQLNLAAS